jgi:hypothetical protein
MVRTLRWSAVGQIRLFASIEPHASFTLTSRHSSRTRADAVAVPPPRRFRIRCGRAFARINFGLGKTSFYLGKFRAASGAFCAPPTRRSMVSGPQVSTVVNLLFFAMFIASLRCSRSVAIAHTRPRRRFCTQRQNKTPPRAVGMLAARAGYTVS